PARGVDRADEPKANQPFGIYRWILPLVLLSGIASFTYEVLWTRLLAHTLGTSIYAFATMLASFLIGITLGSALAARLAPNRRRAAAGFVVAQLGTGLLSAGVFLSLEKLAQLGLSQATL
ncbi:MAG: hypothetical protein V3T77_07375, partial [Planctomycetota bacterium]